MDIAQRYRGCLLGLAVGDAVGTALEFKRPGSFSPIADMIGGGPFGLEPGQWTDDTSMALCLAESLIEKKGFDPTDQMQRYVRWFREGYLSSTGECFDIGSATRAALARFVRTEQAFSGSTDPNTAGNGSIMRLAPVPMFYACDPVYAIEFAAESSRTTHGAATAVDACRYLAALIVGALRGATREELLSDHFSPAKGYWEDHALVTEIREIASGSFRRKEPPEIKGLGYVVRSLEAALWAFYKSKDFREGCLLAVNLGDDTDTTAAVYGQLAGAFYGEAGIPKSWLDKLAMREKIVSLADQLFNLSQQNVIGSLSPGSRSQETPNSKQKADEGSFEAALIKAADEDVLEAPFDRSYWVIPGKFLAGAYPGDPVPEAAEKKLRALVSAGIRYFVDLTSPEDKNLYGRLLVPYRDLVEKIAAKNFKISYRRMPVIDLDVPSHAGMQEILDTIDRAINSGIPLYVHCLGGIGRTGTAVGCWLARHGIAQGPHAIDLIRKLRRNEAHAHIASPETAHQLRFICEWKKGD